MLSTEVVKKQDITKEIINRYICMLYDIWGKNINKIYVKLISVIQDRFKYNKNDLQYIDIQLKKIVL